MRISSNYRVQKGTKFYLHLIAFAMIIMWGLSFISTKELLNNGLNPSQIYLCRFTLAYVCLLSVTSRKKMICDSWKDEFIFLICGLCGGSLYFITENTALKYTLVSNVALIVATAPLITTIFMKTFYKGESLGFPLIIGSLIAFCGVGCVIFNSSFQLSLNPIGDILSIIGAVSWSIYAVMLKKLNGKYSVLFITRKVFFYGVLTCFPFLWILHSDVTLDTFLRPVVYCNLIFLGLGASMSSYLIWNYLVKIIGAVRASNYLYLGPLITLVGSTIFLNEQITMVGYIGCALILGGLILSEKLKI